MEISVLSNEDDSNILSKLNSQLSAGKITRARLAISFLMTSGVNLIHNKLKTLVENDVPIEIVFGDDMGISESEALTKLRSIGCSLSVFRGERKRGYHPKFWVMDYPDGNYAVCIGSPNLSSPALKTNVEAAVFITGTQDELQNCLDLWDSIKKASEPIDDDFIESYKNIEKERNIKLKLTKNGKPDHTTNYKQLEDFANGWMQYIEKPEIKGGTEKWRGWYFLPSQGHLTTSKLRELGRVLTHIEKIPQYQASGYLDISTSKEGIDNVCDIITKSKIKYAGRYSKAHKRALFIRQQKNYLIHLGFLEEISQSKIRITERGYELGAALNDDEIRQALSNSLENIQWDHGNIYFFPFLVELMSSLPDKRLYEDEIDLFIIHTYNQAQLQNRFDILTVYRSLPSNERLKFYDSYHEKLSSLLGTHRNASAHGHYNAKIWEYMIAFGNTKELKYVQGKTPPKSYLLIRS